MPWVADGDDCNLHPRWKHEHMTRSESDDRAATALLMALATARGSGEVTTYVELLAEATTEPARSLVLIDTVVRLVLNLAKDRATEQTTASEDLLPILALVVARRGGAAWRTGPYEEGCDVSPLGHC